MAGSAPIPREEHIYLLAYTPLEEWLDFLTAEGIVRDTSDRDKATEMWRTAERAAQARTESESGWADGAAVQCLPRAFDVLAAQVTADPIFQRSFAAVPVELGLVELDRLVVRQNLVNLSHITKVRERLGPAPTPEQVFCACLPFDHPRPACDGRLVGGDTFEFVSRSNDLRSLECVLLGPEQVLGYRPNGTMAGIAGVAVGFGSNYLNVVAYDGRLVLNNGSHRACGLRQLGVTHVPAIVQRPRNAAELQSAAAGALRRTPERFLVQPRPPLLKDYFDPDLTKRCPLVAAERRVRVRVVVESFDTPLEG